MKGIFLIILVIGLLGCSSTNLLNRKFQGESFSSRRIDLVLTFQSGKKYYINLFEFDKGNFKNSEFQLYKQEEKNQNKEFLESIKLKEPHDSEEEWIYRIPIMGDSYINLKLKRKRTVIKGE